MMFESVNFLIKWCVVSLFFVVFSSFAFASVVVNTNSVVGYWQTFDGKTKKPSSIIEVQQHGQFFEGNIVKTFPVPGKHRTTLCVTCTGSQKNKPILGLTIIKNMQCLSSFCEHGTILDPRNGKIYHATMKLFNQGQALKVRGYVGMPLFGKTVIWKRVSHQ